MMGPQDQQPPTTPQSPPAREFVPQQDHTQATSSDLKRVKILGYMLIGLAVTFIFTSLGLSYLAPIASSTTNANDQFIPSLLVHLVTLLIGIGIVKHSKIAWYAFIVLNSLAIALLSVYVLFIPGLIIMLPLVVLYAVYIAWTFNILLPHRVRALFH